MKKIEAVSMFLAIFITVISIAVCGSSGVAIGASAPAGSPGEGSAQQSEPILADTYSLELLVHTGICVKTLHIKKDDKGNIVSATLDTEHGTQEVSNVSFDGNLLKFHAIIGTDGKEPLDFTLQFYRYALLGYFDGQHGKAPVVGKDVEYWKGETPVLCSP